MPEISLTDFVEFVVKSGTPKLTKVRQLKERDKYDPAADFWRILRKAIVEFHKSGSEDKRNIDKVLAGLTDSKKKNRYPEAIRGYRKFLGKKRTQWFDPPREIWSSSGLDVRVNPELGLILNGDRYIIKLYFKDERLEKRKIAVVLSMMEEVLRPSLKPSDKLAILEVPSGNLFPSMSRQPTVLPLLMGEASSFVTIWNQL